MSERRLAAVLFADIAGYTKLMEQDEQLAFDAIDQFRTTAMPLVDKYGGQWHKDLGDGALCSFISALDAVRCAVGVQEQLGQQETFQVRIGIHLGDVTFRDGDIFGNGVNIAARIQAEAPPGGICFSEAVYRNVSNNQEIPVEPLGKMQLKGVTGAVKLFMIPGKTTGRHPAGKRGVPIFRPEKTQRPSLLVLPFDNLSPDPENEYVSDGLTDELITDLSRIKGLRVIARNSSMKLKNTAKELATIAEELDVRYVLEGSLRRAAANLRISAQLVDTRERATIWAERYKGTPEDIFDFQEQVSRAIVEALQVQLTPNENRSLAERPIPNLVAYDYYLKARRHIFSFREEDLQKARTNLEKGKEIVGENPPILFGLGMVQFQILNAGIARDEPAALAAIQAYGERLLKIAPDSYLGHILTGMLYAHGYGDTPEAIRSFLRAFRIDPHNPDMMVWLGVGLMSTGQLDLSRQIVEELSRVEPLEPLGNLLVGYHAFFRGDFEESIAPLRRSLGIDPNVTVSIWCAVRLYAAAGMKKEALAEAARLNELLPDSPFAESAALFAAALAGDQAGIRKPISPELHRWASRDGEWGQILVDAYGLAGMADESLRWLDICSRAGFINYPFLANHDPFLEPVRHLPPFREALEGIRRHWEAFNREVEELLYS